MRQRAALRGIYAIVGDGAANPVALAASLLEAGIRIVQYRVKRGIDAGQLRTIRTLTKQHGALLIVNDDWQAALRFDADGAHVGPGDAGTQGLGAVRNALQGRVLGISCGSVAEARAAGAAGADYIGVGSVFPTGSKRDAGAPIGIGGLQTIAAASALPVAAVGGITLQNAAEVARSGVAMAAVLSALANAEDPGAAARALIMAWGSA